MDKNAVSIIIASWNNLEYLSLCIDSIEKYTKYPFQLIVVDNGSTDGTYKYLKKDKNVVAIRNRQNEGNPKAVNQAFKKVTTDYFCLLDSDTIVSRNWLTTLVKWMDVNPSFEQLTTNSNCIIDKKDEIKGVSFDSWMDFKEKNKELGPEKLIKRYYGDYDRFVELNRRKNHDIIDSSECPPWFLGGWCILMRTAFVDKIGGFVYDERFKYAYWEDDDLSWRVGIAGGKLGVVRGAYVHHFINTTTSRLEEKPVDLGRTNKYKFMEKWEDFILRELADKSGNDKKRLESYLRKNQVYRKFLEYYGFKKLTENWSS